MNAAQFIPKRTFFSEEFQCEYVEGLSYTIRSKALASLVPMWEEEGKITVYPDGVPSSSGIKGTNQE